jgi:cytochrome P450
VNDLPDFFELVGEGWQADLVATGDRLMVEHSDLGLLRMGDETVVAYRYRDVKALSMAREAGNMPIAVLARRSSARERRSDPDALVPHENAFFSMLADQAFTHNPPLHEHTRRMLGRQFLLHNVHRFDEVALEAARSALVALPGRVSGAADFAEAFARPYVGAFWGAIIGMLPEESAEVVDLMRTVRRVFMLERTPEDTAAADWAAARYVDIVCRATDRGLSGGNELLAQMAADLEAIGEPGKAGSLGAYMAANLFDGFHTVGVAVANTLYVLLAEGRYEDLFSDATLLARASVEALRIASPLLLTHRYTLSPLEYEGVELPVGTGIAMLWGSPNLDPSVFESPHEFRWDRETQVLFTFGGGPHLCPGRNAARMLVEHALSLFVAEGVCFRLVPGVDYRWEAASAMRELVEFPVEVRRPG